MRNSTRICVFVLLSFLMIVQVNGQTWVDSTFQFSTGDNDFNPKFPVYRERIGSYEFEYFVFERYISESSSKVLIQKVDGYGPIGSEIEISNNNAKNINPVIAYNNIPSNYIVNPKYILVVWQTNKNGSEDIYGKYNINGIWSGEFAIDSSSQNSITPEIICKDSTTFFITYEKEGDIIYREFDILSAALTNVQNLTLDDTVHCQRPYISTFGTYLGQDSLIIVSYERRIAVDSIPINYVINSNGMWSTTAVLTNTGLNKNNGFLRQSELFDEGIIAAFEKKHSNYSDLYTCKVKATGITPPENLTFSIPGYNYSNLTGGRPFIVRGEILSIFGFIQDDSFDKNAYFYDFTPVSSTPKLDIQLTPKFSFDSINTSLTSSNSLGKLIPNGSCSVYWFLFNKSETNQYQSRIHGIKFKSCFEVNINPISSEIPNSFALKQNYPNPFNPSTKIRFDIPHSKNVKLSVFNSLGQQVAVLVNEQLQPGIYEYEFMASDYSSGIYFYRLDAEGFSEAKRMVLIK
jgi:hypothetical protein